MDRSRVHGQQVLDAGAQPKGRELRLALGMRGGVSLAVWIGGACAEIEALRTTKPVGGDGETAGEAQGPAAFWGPLLDAAGVGSVRVDVLAGASAGGLNAVLLAASLLYGVPFDRFREIWLEVAQLDKLLRNPRKERQPLSLFNGDKGFLEAMRTVLGPLVTEAAPADGRLRTDYLDVLLSATLLEPVRVPVTTNWGEQHTEASHRAGFRFRHNRFTSDFRADGDPAAENAGLVDKLSQAARATSSFPAAFEPATVTISYPELVGQRAAPADGTNLFGVFSHANDAEQGVIDGGTLDNIPLERAIAGIAASAAAGPTERWLLYLNPSPEAEPDEHDDEEAAPANALGTVMATLAAKGTAECVLDDLALLQAHNERVLRYRAIRHAVLGPLAGDTAEAFGQAAAKQLDQYWQLRTRALAQRISRLLQDPVAVLAEDPFTAHPRERSPLADAMWGPGALEHLDRRLRGALSARVRTGEAWPPTEEAPLALGADALPRLVDLAVEAVWRLERLGADPQKLAQTKASLYRIADAAHLLAHLGDLFWPVYAARHAPDPADLDAWIGGALDAWTALLEDPGTAAAPLADWQQALTAVTSEFDQRLAQAVPKATGAPAAALWQALVAAVQTLGGFAVPPAAASEANDDDHNAETVMFAQVLGYVDAAPTKTTGVLGAVEVLTFPLQALASGPLQHVRFLRVSGAQPSPLGKPADDAEPAGPFPEPLTAANKLAGNDLANFAAFYRASWRANDWMWGRLDAAGALVDLLCQPGALHDHFATAACPLDADPSARAAAFLDVVEALVCRPADPPPGQPADDEVAQAWAAYFTEHLWRPRRERITSEAEALFAGRRPSLQATKAALVARRQWELLISELPTVATTVEREQRDEGDRRTRVPRGDLRTPAEFERVCAGYRIGRETIAGEVGSPRFTKTAADLLVVTFDALTVGLGSVGRQLRPLGSGLRVLRLVARASAGTRGRLRRGRRQRGNR